MPQALADVVDRAIRRQWEERFQSAHEMRDALDAIRSLYQPFATPFDASLTGADDAFPDPPPRSPASRPMPTCSPPASTSGCLQSTPHSGRCSRPRWRRSSASWSGPWRRSSTMTAPNRSRRCSRIWAAPRRLRCGVGELRCRGGGAARRRRRLRRSTRRPHPRCVGPRLRARRPGMQRGLRRARHLHRVPSDASAGRDPAPTCYTRSGDVSLAYQVIGNGGMDLVLVPGWLTHPGGWQWPPLARFCARSPRSAG